MKYLILLLLTPLLIAQSNEDAWENYIENYAGELTHIVCISSGTETKSSNANSIDTDVSSTDYYLFNENHLFARQELNGYRTNPLQVKDDIAPMWLVVKNDQFINGVFTPNEDLRKSISTDEYRMDKMTYSFVINRLTGFYTKKATTNRYYYEFGQDFKSDATETGECEVYDPNAKKF